MKSIWRKKWLVAVIAVAIFLSVGAVAWAAAGDDPVATDEATATTTTTAARRVDRLDRHRRVAHRRAGAEPR